MLMLLAVIGLMRSCIQRLLRWFLVLSRARKGYRLPQSSCGDKHRHSSHKPEWVKHEIIRLKAVMPHAGCRSIADICNRRFAASRKVTVGKTYVHQVLQRYDYESPESAEKWLLRAARAGSAGGAFELVSTYERGGEGNHTARLDKALACYQLSLQRDLSAINAKGRKDFIS